MNAPWLTVVMPTYNGERWLRYLPEDFALSPHRIPGSFDSMLVSHVLSYCQKSCSGGVRKGGVSC